MEGVPLSPWRLFENPKPGKTQGYEGCRDPSQSLNLYHTLLQVEFRGFMDPKPRAQTPRVQKKLPRGMPSSKGP